MLVFHEHGRRSGVRLDVVHIEPQPLEADQVLDRDEDDARDGHLGHRPENYHFLLGCNVHTVRSNAQGFHPAVRIDSAIPA